MWWTQPKLALLFVGGNTLVCWLAVLASDVPLVQVASLIAAQAVLLLAYVNLAHRLGAGHLAGQTEVAFEANIWNTAWNPFRDKYSHPPDLIPRAGGGSFYQQVLADVPDGRESLYRGLSLWEGARFLWVGNTVAVAVAVGWSSIGLTLTHAVGREGSAPVIASALAVPVCVLLGHEAINITLLKRSMLRRGTIPRTAMLVPRDAIDLGLRFESAVPPGVGREIILILSAVLGVPILFVVGLAAGVRTATLGAAAISIAVAAGLWFFHAFYRLLVSGIPFLHLSRSLEVSVALDLAHRQRARLSVGALFAMLYIVSWYSPNGPNAPSLMVPTVCLGYLLAITFGDQFAGYAGFVNATHFESCFKRSLAKVQAATS